VAASVDTTGSVNNQPVCQLQLKFYMNLPKAQMQNYKFTHKEPYPQCSGTKVGWEQPWKLCNHSVNFNFTSFRQEKHGITEGKMMPTLPEKLKAWQRFVTFNIDYNLHTKHLEYLLQTDASFEP